MAFVANVTLVVLSLLMGARLVAQYIRRPRPHTLSYGVGLLLTAAAAFPEVYREWFHTLPTGLWWLYWSAASALVGFLAVGTAYLLSPTLGRATLAVACLLTLAVTVASVATAGPAPTDFTESPFVRAPNGYIKTPFLIQNIAGSLLIAGGAVWSWIKTRGWFAVWIALGTFVFAAGGASAGLLQYSDIFYFTQTIGILILYTGIAMSLSFRGRPSTAHTEVSYTQRGH